MRFIDINIRTQLRLPSDILRYAKREARAMASVRVDHISGLEDLKVGATEKRGNNTGKAVGTIITMINGEKYFATDSRETIKSLIKNEI